MRKVSGYESGSGDDKRQQEAIAKRASTTQATVSRWLNNGRIPKPAMIALFCQGFGRNVLEGFVAAGVLDEKDAGRGLPPSSHRFLAEVRLMAAETGVHLEPGEVDKARAAMRAALPKKAPSQPPRARKVSRSRRRAAE